MKPSYPQPKFKGGERVIIKSGSDHPWNGELGTVKAEDYLLGCVGLLCVVNLDNGEECVVRNNELQILK